MLSFRKRASKVSIVTTKKSMSLFVVKQQKKRNRASIVDCVDLSSFFQQDILHFQITKYFRQVKITIPLPQFHVCSFMPQCRGYTKQKNSFYFVGASLLDYLCLGNESKHFYTFIATFFTKSFSSVCYGIPMLFWLIQTITKLNQLALCSIFGQTSSYSNLKFII